MARDSVKISGLVDKVIDRYQLVGCIDKLVSTDSKYACLSGFDRDKWHSLLSEVCKLSGGALAIKKTYKGDSELARQFLKIWHWHNTGGSIGCLMLGSFMYPDIHKLADMLVDIVRAVLGLKESRAVSAWSRALGV